MAFESDRQQPIRNLAPRSAPMISPDTSLEVAARLMQIAGVSLVAVVDRGSVVGAITQRAVMATIADGERLASVRADEVASTRFISIDGSLPIMEVAGIMADDDSRTVLVRRDGGIATVSMDDVIDFVLRRESGP